EAIALTSMVQLLTAAEVQERYAMVPSGTETGPLEPFILPSIRLVAADNSEVGMNIIDKTRINRTFLMEGNTSLPDFICVIGPNFLRVERTIRRGMTYWLPTYH